MTHAHERDKSRVLATYQSDKDAWQVERQVELDRMRQLQQEELNDVEAVATERQQRDGQVRGYRLLVLFIDN